MHIHQQPSPDLTGQISQLNTKLDQITTTLTGIKGEENAMQADLTAIQAAVANCKTVEDGAVTLIQNIASQLTALSQQTTIDPAALQSLADQLNTGAQPLADAIVANTPAAPSA